MEDAWISIQNNTAVYIPNLIKSIRTRAKNVIIVEKEAIFNHVKQEYDRIKSAIGDFIIITVRPRRIALFIFRVKGILVWQQRDFYHL